MSSLPMRKVGEHRMVESALSGAMLSGAAERFATHKLAAGRWRESTAVIHRKVLAQAIAILGDRPVASITAEDMERVWLTIAGRSSPQWTERARVALLSLFRWLQRHRAIGENPMLIWEPTEIDEDDHQRIYHDYTKAEVQRLTEHAAPRFFRLIWTACLTGHRRSNLRCLRWRDIDETWMGEIDSRRFKQRRRHRFPFHPALEDLLGPRRAPDDLVLPGLPKDRQIGKALKRLSRRAGLPEEWAYMHQFRRTWCAWFKAAGGTKEEAMALLGSRSMSILIRHYWPDTTDGEKREWILKL